MVIIVTFIKKRLLGVLVYLGLLCQNDIIQVSLILIFFKKKPFWDFTVKNFTEWCKQQYSDLTYIIFAFGETKFNFGYENGSHVKGQTCKGQNSMLKEI